MKFLKLSIILIFVFNSEISFSQKKYNSQNRTFKKGLKKYKNFGYIDASKIFLKVAKAGFRSEELLTKLGDSYYFTSNYKEAVKWYKELYAFKKGDISSKYLLRYSQSLRSKGEDALSEQVYNEYLKKAKTKNSRFLSTKDYIDIIETNSNRYKISSFINSKYIDFGGFEYKDTLYFASTRNQRSSIRRNDEWVNQPFLDIYYTTKDSANKCVNPKRLKGLINTKEHESSIAITKDGRTMYFTRSNTTYKRKKLKGEHAQLKIYRATKIKGKWTNPEDLHINGDGFSTAHPVLNKQENRLYYVSNTPLSIGQTDIWYVDVSKRGILGKPVNLGPKINTKGRESFPFITAENELYFSSDGHFGLGGYDVFYADLRSKDIQIINIGKPINSQYDDYAFSINTKTKKGFFSSNRNSKDDIFSLKELNPIRSLIEGVVIDSITKLPIVESLIKLRNRNNIDIGVIKTDKKGKFMFKSFTFFKHTLIASKEGYKGSEYIVPKNNKGSIVIKLAPMPKIKEGLNIVKPLNIVIYFDFDKYEIQENAKIEIEKVVAFLESYPKINLFLKAHTDSQGAYKYNLILSEKRAQATKNYIISRGVSPYRVTIKSYGETKLVNECFNNVKCTKKQHALNRRTEFIIQKTKN